jgi:hypothetical protein
LREEVKVQSFLEVEAQGLIGKVRVHLSGKIAKALTSRKEVKVQPFLGEVEVQGVIGKVRVQLQDKKARARTLRKEAQFLAKAIEC